MTATAEMPVDQGPCGECGCGQWDHRQGKKGCKDPGCGCGKYEPPKGAPPPVEQAALVVAPDSPVPGVVVDGPAVLGPGVQVGEPLPAEPGDVALPVLRAAEPEPAVLRQPRAAVAARLRADLERVTRERDGCEVQRDQAYERVNELTAELGREQAEHQATLREKSALNTEVLRLRAELDRVNADRQRAQDVVDEATWGSPQASLVLWRYDADQCLTEGCGSRYTVPTEHPHPLTPVTVLVVRREVTR
ncbi:hypothetical protein [Micromonospora tarensis]|uniref:Uncharacterized protein n=1 Tax=Micromonospora tarensis TaxID=2806100 RepID=A0ABS1YCW5_9ACTN|nr:hypothetical protein [Micromonospora tarensis]MBM0275129.1 hypothetical protein [Micromonospora tarensis]